MEFPRMVYRVGTKCVLETGTYDGRIVTQSEWPQAQADGWHLDQYAARDAAADNAPPTRAEMEQQAVRLGIKVDGRWSDKKLRDVITAAMEA